MVAVLLAALVGQVLGLDTTAVAVVVVAALVIGSLRWFGEEAATIATTALVVLTTGSTDDSLLVSRLADTGIGVGVGLLVNAVVWPPLRRRTAVAALARLDERLGQLLEDMGRRLAEGDAVDEVEDWIERSRDLDELVDDAWAMVRQVQESARLNPRRSARAFRDPQQWYDRVHRREQAIAEIRSMARTLGGRMPRAAAHVDPVGRVWADLLTDTGRAVGASDASGVWEVRRRLEQLVADIGDAGTTPRWPVHGALIINLRNLLDAMDEVVAVSPRLS